jgi:[protein-PII] uridylyltransferase
MAHARGLLQFNEYHKYTVDEHSIRAVDFATDLVRDQSVLGEAYRSIKDKRLLHLALLLHDLGKGHPGDHSIVGKQFAAETAKHLHLNESETDIVCFLVEKHLRMSHLAQRRDIHDDEVVVQFAVEVGSLQRLRMLYVLTCSDLAAVGPGVLNDWKQNLITQLYLHTRECLAGEGISSGSDERLAKRREEIRALAKEANDDPWWNRQIEGMPKGYVFGVPSEQIIEELKLLKSLPHNDAVAWGRWLPGRNAVEYTIGAYEEITPGIFHKLTGALTSKRMQILTAEIHTLAGHLVLDRFYVHDLDYSSEPPVSRLEEVNSALVAALKDKSGKPPVFTKVWRTTEKFIEDSVKLPTQVRVDTVSSDRFTIIDIFAHDRLGLLYDISRTIFELGLSVELAKISTHLDQVVDVFYVTDQSGKKILDDARLAAIRRALVEALEQPVAVSA